MSSTLKAPTHAAFGSTTGHLASSDITIVVFPDMAHMHNFADTPTQLWDRFMTWLPVTRK
jgi:hypothetical protein